MINCPRCHAVNRGEAAFCRHCGRLLSAACPTCGAAASAGANFCDTCGRPLGPGAWLGGLSSGEAHALPDSAPPSAVEAPPAANVPPVLNAPPTPAPPYPPASDPLQQFIPRELQDKLLAARRSGTMAGERRVVTMLFCDIKGSTALAEQLDPEEWSDIVNGCFERMVRPIYRYEGTVARLMGDGLLAFFGAPIAHEDDPRRAVLAGLEIVAGMAEFRASRPGVAQALDVRVGINTGLVVVGAVGSDLRLEYSALGDAINVAARMEQTALPGTVQITEDTLRSIAGQFDVEPLGSIEVKGKAAPVSAYRILRRRTGMELRAFQMAFHAPLVDRLREWDLLRGTFEALAGGRGGIVVLSGDAGLGKTRLIDEALERLAPTVGAQIAVASAYAYEMGQPYGVIIRLLRGALGIMAGDPPETVRAHIDAAVASDEGQRVLATLLGVAPDAPGQELNSQIFAQQFVACLETFWRTRADAAPVVVVLDDLQWIDASSASLMAQLFALSESAAVLFLCAMRRERQSDGWRLRDVAHRDFPHRFDEAALYPLTDSDSLMLLDGLLDGSALPEAYRRTILGKAEGNPLFVQEVVHSLIDRGHLVRQAEGAPWTAAGSPDAIELPGSLQALLTARIDRLTEDTRRVLQIASVVGRTFTRSTLLRLVDDPAGLDRQLLDLQRAELVREVGRVPEPEYTFHHNLTHEATYNTILVKERRALHLRVAAALADKADNQAALAHHFLEGNAPERALPCLVAAADAALRLNATVEALANYDRALSIALTTADATLLGHLYASRGRALELRSQFVEADAVYAALEALARDRGEPSLELAALIAQGKLRANVTPLRDAPAARGLMERALTLAEALDDRPAEVRILWNLLNIDRFDIHNLPQSAVGGARALALARELGLQEETAYLLNDLGEALGSLGRMIEAHDMLAEAVQYWRALGNEPMLIDGLTGQANWALFSGSLLSARALADEAYDRSLRIDNPWSQAYSGGVSGLLYTLQGEVGAGLDRLNRSLARAEEAGFVGGLILMRAFISKTLLAVGATTDAMTAAAEGAAIGRAHLPQFAGMCLAQLALANLRSGNTAAAAELLSDPLINVEHPQAFVEIDAKMGRIGLAVAEGRPGEALQLVAALKARIEEMGTVFWLPEILQTEADILLALGRASEAAGALAAAADLSRRSGARFLLWAYLAQLADVQDQLGDGRAAETRADAITELATITEHTWPDALRESLAQWAATISPRLATEPTAPRTTPPAPARR